ncbi:Beta-galactosidase YesZ [bacterium HR17]|uniref:Beta-galactosidase YesZ n=1 Tax=Candidatus Fervidibacter japonicus TaxID=2035412 RepID=A0A2H5X9P6_9BACT|nr:Beta-galactosidase YesZ [bacterium HR17]
MAQGILRLSNLKVEQVTARPNLVPNCSFEQVSSGGTLIGWQWDKRNTDSTCTVDETQARSGKRSLKFINNTPFGAHVYGTLWLAEPIRLQAGKPYTLSAYIKSDDPGIAWIGGGANWQFRLRIPPTQGKWQRISMTFVPSERDTNFVLRIVTESPTKGFWVDDVKLEEGNEATFCQPYDERVVLEPTQIERNVEGDGEFTLTFDLFLPEPLPKALFRVQIGRTNFLQKSLPLQQGTWRVLVKGEAVGVDDSPKMLTLQLFDGSKRIASAETIVRFFSPQNASSRLNSLRRKLSALKSRLDSLKGKGMDISYPLVTFTVLENFVNYAEEDLKHSETRRAFMQISDMEAMAKRLERELSEALAGRRNFPEVPRWTGTERPKVVGPSFVAPVTFPSRPSSLAPRPVFFVGYGHFGQVRADIEKFPRYGINIIQIEFGPNSVFPSEGVVSEEPIRETLSVLDRAAKAGVAVNLLISPHYFPRWMLEKYPHLRKRREGFLQFCLHAPESQDLLKRYIAKVIPPLKDHPALHSICLTNEPVNAEEPCEFALRDWHDWLRNRHGNIQTLNKRWGTNFARFEDIPLPNPLNPTLPPSPQSIEFVRFNQEWFANWHKMLADVIKAIAPDLPVHAKAMTWTMVNDPDVRYGVDAELFASFSDINGNDSVNFYSHGIGEFAQGWLLNAMAYDLQRSVKDAPVFNSENHIIPDRETRYVPPEHIRAALWQGAVYGQSATTIWVWERTFDPKSDFAGSIMHRPACAEAAGLTCLDLNRLAEEVTALQKAPAQVAILHSVSSLVWDGGRYTDCRNKLYTALTFTGVKVGFVTERQLERGIEPDVPVLFVPNIVHLSDAAFETLKHYKGHIVLVGNGNLLSRNEYGIARNTGQWAQSKAEQIGFECGRTSWRDLWQALSEKLKALGVKPLVEVRDEKGARIWGVAWRCVETPRGVVINLCNYRHDPVKVRLWSNGEKITGIDLLGGEKLPRSFTLSPLQIRLLLVR